MTNEETPWEQIQKDYVLGVTDDNGLKHFPTYKQLSEKYGLSEGTIKNKAGPEKWSQQKKSHKLKVTKKVIEKKSHDLKLPSTINEKDEEEAAEFDAESIIQSDEKFEGTGEDLRKLVQLSIDEKKLALKNGGYVKEYGLKMLGDALKSAQDVVKTAQGEITERIGIESKGPTIVEQVKDLFKFAKEGNDKDGDD